MGTKEGWFRGVMAGTKCPMAQEVPAGTEGYGLALAEGCRLVQKGSGWRRGAPAQSSADWHKGTGWHKGVLAGTERHGLAKLAKAGGC